MYFLVQVNLAYSPWVHIHTKYTVSVLSVTHSPYLYTTTQSCEKWQKPAAAFLERFKPCFYHLTNVCYKVSLSLVCATDELSFDKRVQTTNSAVRTLLRVRVECASGQVAHTASFTWLPWHGATGSISILLSQMGCHSLAGLPKP